MTPGDRTGIESLSGGDRLGTGGPGLEAGEAGSSPSGGAPGSGPEGGHQGSCPASHPAFNPKEAEGCLPCVSMAATLSQPRSLPHHHLPQAAATLALCSWGSGPWDGGCRLENHLSWTQRRGAHNRALGLASTRERNSSRNATAAAP